MLVRAAHRAAVDLTVRDITVGLGLGTARAVVGGGVGGRRVRLAGWWRESCSSLAQSLNITHSKSHSICHSQILLA